MEKEKNVNNTNIIEYRDDDGFNIKSYSFLEEKKIPENVLRTKVVVYNTIEYNIITFLLDREEYQDLLSKYEKNLLNKINKKYGNWKNCSCNFYFMDDNVVFQNIGSLSGNKIYKKKLHAEDIVSSILGGIFYSACNPNDPKYSAIKQLKTLDEIEKQYKTIIPLHFAFKIPYLKEQKEMIFNEILEKIKTGEITNVIQMLNNLSVITKQHNLLTLLHNISNLNKNYVDRDRKQIANDEYKTFDSMKDFENEVKKTILYNEEKIVIGGNTYKVEKDEENNDNVITVKTNKNKNIEKDNNEPTVKNIKYKLVKINNNNNERNSSNNNNDQTENTLTLRLKQHNVNNKKLYTVSAFLGKMVDERNRFGMLIRSNGDVISGKIDSNLVWKYNKGKTESLYNNFQARSKVYQDLLDTLEKGLTHDVGCCSESWEIKRE